MKKGSESSLETTCRETLGKVFFNFLQDYKISQNNILSIIQDIKADINQLQKNLSSDSVSLMQNLQNKLIRADKKLAQMDIFGSPFSLTGTQQTASILLKQSFEEIPSGLFLKKTKIIELLKQHPPTSLTEHYEADSVETLLETMAPECIIALSRHSETSIWQKEYQSLLEGLKYSDFENRDIQTYSIDTAFIKLLFQKNNHHVKPWRLSHSKEAGVILIFTQEDTDTLLTPYLLQIAVFLHYIYEVSYASFFFQYNDTEKIGKRVAQLIKGHKPAFPFLQDKNVYTETLYWDLALETLIKKWCPEDLKDFEYTSMAIDPSKKSSLNMIDMLWDMNLPSDSDNYFNQNKPTYTYHAAQSTWTQIIYSASMLSKEKINSLLVKTLHKDDHAITKQLLGHNN